MIVDKIDTWLCETPIAHPIDLGKFTVLKRSYLAVRLQTSDGLVADCVTQVRGSPIDVVIADVIAPRVLGKDARDVAAITAQFKREMTALDLHGAIGRAWSAVEICLQDLRAQACRWPLWRLLGGAPRPVPVLLVEGYAIRGEPDEAFVDRLVARVDEGFSLLKIEAGHYVDGASLLRHLEQFRSRAGSKPQLVLDMAWSWSESKSQMAMLRALEDLGIAWFEDPFSSDRVHSYQDLRRSTGVPLGGGDETSRAESMFALLEANALDVVRLDATVMGGIDAARALSLEGARRGVRVSYHVHPEIHEHLVFGLGIADHVEVFPTDRHFDRVHDLITSPLYDRVREGQVAPNETPGTGITLDLTKMKPFIRRHQSADRGAKK